MIDDKKTLATFFRILISIVILAFLFYKYGDLAFTAVSKIISLGGSLFLVFATILHFGEKFVRIYSFKILIKKNGVDLNFLKLTRISFISNFFGFIMPGTQGEDVVRVFYLRKYFSGFAAPLSSTITLNVGNIFCAGVLALLGLALTRLICWDVDVVLLNSIVLLSTAIIAICLTALIRPIRQFFLQLTSYHYGKLLDKPVGFLNRVVHHFDQQIETQHLMVIFLLSMLCFMVAIFRTHLLALAFGLDVHLVYFIILVPVVTILTALPLSFAGIGVRESAFIFFLGTLNVDEGSAFALGLFVTLLNFLFTLSGGLIYLSDTLRNEKTA